jgi:3-deoxy-manno-octulosonate cytidylyltransferase (CMP-KDO synthetase)
MKTAIVIPARYASTRFPGKPLVKIAGQSMLQRVARLAQAASAGIPNISIVVATDDERIMRHCHEIEVPAFMTSPDAATGTDRVAEVAFQLTDKPDFILNLQGDAPLTPPDFLRALIDSFSKAACDVVTPVAQLTWEQLDKFRQTKQSTPFSGTTAVFNEASGQAFWFSKSIIPAIRKETDLRKQSTLSPVYRHIGLYGYSIDMLQKFIKLPESNYEKLEGLEQLRLLENGFVIRCVPVDFKGRANMSGIDSPEDVVRAEDLIAKHGELLPLKQETAK